ncbi:MAG: hypothetical protein H6742_13800 [Alphaproteobacteria bacterium]|nr:hypothetical protein [Alphaproteobacteria bacterium]
MLSVFALISVGLLAACKDGSGGESGVPGGDGGTDGATDSGGDSGGGVPETAHWMADVFPAGDTTAFGRILVPGGFNSSSYACARENGISPDSPDTVLLLWGEGDGNEEYRERIVGWSKTQDLSIGEQLQAGVRFIEINLTVKDGALVTWHSVYGVPVAVVLSDLVAFAAASPDEIVLLTFGLSVDEADWGLFGDAVTTPLVEGTSLCDLVYDGAEDIADATLADIRASGRNVLWAPGGDLRAWLLERGDCPLSSGDSERAWSITDTTTGVEEALAASVDSRDPAKVLINDFVFSLGGAESAFEQASYIAEYSGQQEASIALGFAGDFPARLIDTYDADGNMNIFAGAFIQDTDLVAAAIARNRAR